MKDHDEALADARQFLETFGFEREQADNAAAPDVSSKAARRSDVYQRSLARAYLSELRSNRAA